MRCKYRTGQIVPLWGTPAEYDYLLLCDGSQISAELYPELVKVLGGNTLPDLVGRFLEGAGSAGEYRAAGLPNITGNIAVGTADGQAATFGYGGALANTGNYPGLFSLKNCPVSSGNTLWTGGIFLNARASNLIYGSSTTVQPKSMTVKYYICYAG